MAKRLTTCFTYRPVTRRGGWTIYLDEKKDTADCLAAICYFATHHVHPFTMADKIEGASFAAAMARPHLGGTVTGIPVYQGFGSAMEQIRHLQGIGCA